MTPMKRLFIIMVACSTAGCLCFAQADCPGMHSIDVISAEGDIVTDFVGRVMVHDSSDGFDVVCRSR